MHYKKYKERSPEDTVFEIRRILHEAGLFPVTTWTERECEGLRSCRVILHPSRLMGQNGKGTDEKYAAASGFAELMERLENGWLWQKLMDDEFLRRGGFHDFPDEEIKPIAELLAQDNPYLPKIFESLGLRMPWQRRAFLEKLAKECYSLTDGTILALPYVDIFAQKIVYIPFALITLFGVSNGMTAGNTMEEALVQGMSELYERHVHMTLMQGNITPPEIPRRELEACGIIDVVRRLEEGGRYAVSLRDCSLGEGYPVTAAIIFDKGQGTFGVRLGAHPSFAVSIERTLTEAFQGRKLEFFASQCYAGTVEEVCHYHNIPNVMKVGTGAWPVRFLTGKPSYPYRPWREWESKDNGEHLDKLLAHAKAHGYRPLVRDSSHLGFPAFHILIPGIHHIYPVSMMRVREFWSQLSAARSLNHFPDLTEDEEKRLLNYLKFKNGSVEADLGLTLMHDYVVEAMQPRRIAAFLAFKRGEFALSRRFFRTLAASDEKNRAYYSCYALLARHLEDGLSLEDAHGLLSLVFSESVSSRVVKETRNLAGLMGRVFPRLSCFDCGKCPLSGTGCEYAAVRELRVKIKDAMGRSKVSQKAFLEKIGFFLAERI